MSKDLNKLRREHPGWQITARWTAVATGPDHWKLVAHRADVVLTAASAAELAAKIDRAKRL